MEPSTVVVPIVVALITSGGFWSWLNARRSDHDHRRMLLIGLGRITILDMVDKYTDRGWISIEEYEDFVKYLYHPYTMLGGNHSIGRAMKSLNELPNKKEVTLYAKEEGD